MAPLKSRQRRGLCPRDSPRDVAVQCRKAVKARQEGKTEKPDRMPLLFLGFCAYLPCSCLRNRRSTVARDGSFGKLGDTRIMIPPQNLNNGGLLMRQERDANKISDPELSSMQSIVKFRKEYDDDCSDLFS